VSAAGELGALLDAEEAGRIAAELRQSGLVHRASRWAYVGKQPLVKSLLAVLVAEQGGTERAGAVLDGIAAVPRVGRPDVVWTSPSVPGVSGRTTLAAAEMINEAERSVYAATFSASWGSSYVTTLANAVQRGVAVTIVVDRKMQHETGDMLLSQLPGAAVWTYALTDDSTYPPRQHAKFVIVDDAAALVTSANFSHAAASTNLECGLLTRDPLVIGELRAQVNALRAEQVLVDY
jgi:phosphatidylserine/phosphatidylglycerophosphate/cardiolipin synthase-like enzyme